MVSLFRTTLVIFSGALLFLPALATQTDTDKYHLIVYDGCKTVAIVELDANQAETYIKLERASDRMRELENPIHRIEPLLTKYSAGINQISKQLKHIGYRRAGKTLHQKQHELAVKTDNFRNGNAHHFQALEKQRNAIVLAAHEFESLVTKILEGVHYDQVQVNRIDSK